MSEMTPERAVRLARAVVADFSELGPGAYLNREDAEAVRFLLAEVAELKHHHAHHHGECSARADVCPFEAENERLREENT